MHILIDASHVRSLRNSMTGPKRRAQISDLSLLESAEHGLYLS